MQRVAIGRALVRRPSIYLMDEPLSSLDAKLRADLRLELVRIQQELGATILYVTHDQIEAMTMADRIGVMEAGRLVQVGTPRADLRGSARRSYVATTARSAGREPHPARPSSGPAGRRRGTAAHRRADRAPAPHAGRTGRARRKSLVGSLSWIEHLGDQNHLHLAIGDMELVTLADPESGLSVGDRDRRGTRPAPVLR